MSSGIANYVFPGVHQMGRDRHWRVGMEPTYWRMGPWTTGAGQNQTAAQHPYRGAVATMAQDHVSVQRNAILEGEIAAC